MVRGGMIGAVIGAAAGYGAVRLWGAPLVPALVEGAAAGAVVVLLFVGPTWYAAYRTLAEGRLPPARRSAPRRPPDGMP